MPSKFDLEMAKADGIIDAYMGEAVGIFPMENVEQVGWGRDPHRREKIIRGTFMEGGGAQPLEGDRRGAEGRGTTNFVGGSGRLWIVAQQLALLGYEIVDNDQVEIRGKRWSVSRVEPSDIGDATLILART